MLVFTRRVEEEIAIGPPEAPIAVVRLTRASNGKARIGVTTRDPKMPVHRREVAEQIRRAGARKPGGA